MPNKLGAPFLPGWISLVGLADVLGISRQAVHQHADNGTIHTLHQVRGCERPMWIVAETEIPELRARLDAARRGPDPRAPRNTDHGNDDTGEAAQQEQENAVR